LVDEECAEGTEWVEDQARFNGAVQASAGKER
jgi:hypothetical protein